MYKIVSTQKLIKKLFQSHPKIKCLQYIHRSGVRKFCLGRIKLWGNYYILPEYHKCVFPPLT